MELLWLGKARKDLAALRGYIARDNPQAARRVATRIRASARSLIEYPELGRKGRVEGTREFVVPGTPFIIAYRILPGSIHILAVLHAARQWPDNLNDD